MNLWDKIKYWFGWKLPEIYVNQPVIDKYEDHEYCGEWSIIIPDDAGIMVPGKIKGKIYSRTVKFRGQDGKIKLGKDWVTKEEWDK